mgnify:FL=1
MRTGHVLSAEYGKAKVDEGLPQVNVAYFLDRKRGYQFMCMAQNRNCNTIYGLKFKGKPFEKSRNEYFLYLYYNEGDVATLAAAKQDSIEYISKHLAGKKDDKRRI